MKKMTFFAMLVTAVIMYGQPGSGGYGHQGGSGQIGFDGGLELGFPMGNFGDAAGMGFGFSGKGYYPINPEVDLTGRLGYIYFSGEHDDVSFSEIPIMFGGRYKMPNNFYGSAELGFTVFTVKWDRHSHDETELTFTFGGGMIRDKFDFMAFINSVQTEGKSANHFGLRVAYRFM